MKLDRNCPKSGPDHEIPANISLFLGVVLYYIDAIRSCVVMCIQCFVTQVLWL